LSIPESSNHVIQQSSLHLVSPQNLVRLPIRYIAAISASARVLAPSASKVESNYFLLRIQPEYAKSCYKGRLAQKTMVIYNPVTMGQGHVGAALRTEKKHMIVTAGRLEPVKNQRMIIEAFDSFHKTHKDYKLVIYGEGPMRQQLEDLIQERGLQKNAILAGRSDKVWDAMIGADCFLLSSNYEGMSNAMIEAMCLGLPVISTKVSGATDLIEDGINGFLIEKNDSEGMSSRMSQIADNKELQKQLGEKAVGVYNLLRSDVICQQWVDYLVSLV